MKWLSLFAYNHLSAAAVIEDGAVRAAACEERFDRVKFSNRFPRRALDWCLKETGFGWEDFDGIAIPWNPLHNVAHANSRWTDSLRWRGEMLSHLPIELTKLMGADPVQEWSMQPGKLPVIFVDHHVAHAACSYFLSPFESAHVLTVDGHGEKVSTGLFYGQQTQLKSGLNVSYPHSLGLFYGTLTEFLGFRPDQEEWKTMALASYGSPLRNEYVSSLRQLVRLTNTGFELDLSFFAFFTFDKAPHWFSPKLPALLGKPRLASEPIERRHEQIAFALQLVFCETMDHLQGLLQAAAPQRSNRLCLGGGAAMNCVYNGLITDRGYYNELFVPPCPDDTGVAIGAALWLEANRNPAYRRVEHRHNFWGPSFSDEAVERVLVASKVRYQRVDSVERWAAVSLAEGKIIGWFQGAMEFGQRALGGRSILADPRHGKMRDYVNDAVKFRESFRPFAPAVLKERAGEIFQLGQDEEVLYMERAVPVRLSWRDKIPAVVHVDGTARVQTICSQTQPRFHHLVREFAALTGIPVILNTSFNRQGEPIVNSPEDALRTFFTCGLDALVMGSFILEK